MTIKLFNTLFDEVLTDVAGVTQAVALNAIRSSAIEFCDRSCAWVVTATAMDSIALQGEYVFSIPAGMDAVMPSQVWYNGLEIYPRTPAQLQDEYSAYAMPWSEITGTPEFFTSERSDKLMLVPAPDTAILQSIKAKVAVTPSRDATGMEQWLFDAHYEGIAHGAKYRLFAMQGKPWSSPDAAAFHKKMYEQAINDATNTSVARVPPLVTSPSPI